MANKIMELKPIMTKTKALTILMEYASTHGIPIVDVVVYREYLDGNMTEWTFLGLRTLLID